LKLRLLLPDAGERDAIGAEVIVAAAGKKYWAAVQPATSYVGSNDPAVHFGLGAAASVDSIEVLWPDGSKETFAGGPVDRLMTLKKGAR
jgi:hypothetical protein